MAEKNPVPVPLLLGAERPAERSDAARNRRKILDATAHIVAHQGIDALSIHEVAQLANLGVGTVYRRFGDRAGLIFALLDEREQEFQHSFLAGPPPLGPGAEPKERIRAFLHALADRVYSQRDLLLQAEISSPMARFRSGPYTVYHSHLVALIDHALPDADGVCLADSLLAPLAARVLTFQIDERGLTLHRIKAGLDALLDQDW